MEFIFAHKVEVLAMLLAVSEVMAFIPGIKANGIFDGIVGLLKLLVSKKPE